jgi:hypothetical protein
MRRGNFAPVVEILTTTTDLLLVTISLLKINISTDNTDNERYLTWLRSVLFVDLVRLVLASTRTGASSVARRAALNSTALAS